MRIVMFVMYCWRRKTKGVLMRAMRGHQAVEASVRGNKAAKGALLWEWALRCACALCCCALPAPRAA